MAHHDDQHAKANEQEPAAAERDRAAKEEDRAADEQLETTAEHWREPHRGTKAEDSADEIARGAERAKEQPGYGREGS